MMSNSKQELFLFAVEAIVKFVVINIGAVYLLQVHLKK